MYKPLHQYRVFPRPNFGVKPYDYEGSGATPDKYPHRLKDPPKLWVAWIYRNPTGDNYWIHNDLKFLFGEEWKVNLCIVAKVA